MTKQIRRHFPADTYVGFDAEEGKDVADAIAAAESQVAKRKAYIDEIKAQIAEAKAQIAA